MEEKSTKKVLNLIVVDESGSMSSIYDQALDGMNETLTTCKLMEESNPELEQRVTLVTFDSGHYKVHYDNVKAADTAPLTKKDYRPGGCTPLYDAIGKSVSTLNAQAEEGDAVLVTIITDGMENASKEYTLKMVKNLIEKQKQQGWTFALIGTSNLDVESMARSMAIDNKLSFVEDAEGTRQMWKTERSSRMRFTSCLLRNREIGDYFSALD